MDTYLTIKETTEGLYKEKGSRFIAFAIPVKTTDEVKENIQFLHKKYHDARHICYAYVLGADTVEYRTNDDGEPSGTAGKPIHGVLLTHKLTDVLIAVVRYFGGVKLGTSGLIAAYREASADAILHAKIVEKTIACFYTVSFQFATMNDVMKILKNKGCDIMEQSFDNDCEIHFNVRKSMASAVESNLLKIAAVKVKLLKTK